MDGRRGTGRLSLVDTESVKKPMKPLISEAQPATKEERFSAPELVRVGLRNAIMSGEIAPGTQLRQDEIASRFGTSRIPVREALRHLAAEGLVKLQPNKGAVVKSYSVDEIIELLEIRIGLETRALYLAIPNMAEEEIKTASEILASYDAEPRPEKWSEMNWQFHKALYTPCNLPRLLSLIELNWNQSSSLARLQVSIASGKENPNREHWHILEACRKSQVKEAVTALEQHIVNTQKSLYAYMRRQKLRSV
jgi:DNA-binding GntR family transcriptional regulator